MASASGRSIVTRVTTPAEGARVFADSLPVIGPSRRHPTIIYAFGHGHLGLTQSAATARLVRDLVTGAPPAIDLGPYRPGRFFFSKDTR